MSQSHRLITIGPSHYCEKARWALDFFGVIFSEEPHRPVLLPPQFGAALPSLEQLPETVVELISELRVTAAGTFGLRLYRDHR